MENELSYFPFCTRKERAEERQDRFLSLLFISHQIFDYLVTVEEIASCVDIQYRSKAFDQTQTLMINLKRLLSNSNAFDQTQALLIKQECF